MFAEHQMVETDVDIYREGHYIPEGSNGVIVHIYPEKDAYEIEFPMIKNNPVITCHEHEITEAVNEK